MLNIIFSLFLFGMLLSLCIRAFIRVRNGEQPLNTNELALLVALSLGCLAALTAGVSAVYHTQLLF